MHLEVEYLRCFAGFRHFFPYKKQKNSVFAVEVFLHGRLVFIGVVLILGKYHSFVQRAELLDLSNKLFGTLAYIAQSAASVNKKGY